MNLFKHFLTPSQRIEVIVDGGYQPSRVEVTQGERVQLVFLRQESAACSRELVFPSLGIRKVLPQGQAVPIQLPELAPGTYEFECGMGMLEGELTVRPRS
jgi:plastocyanin domain-containing protein